MIKLHRLQLSANTARTLSRRHQKVINPQAKVEKKDPTNKGRKIAITDEKEKAAHLWANRGSTAADREILDRLASATGGKCAYCESNDATEVDHFDPKSCSPRSCFVWTNYVGVCGRCNREKGDTYPIDSDGGLLLNPYEDDPQQFFCLSPSTGKWVTKPGLGTRATKRAQETYRELGLTYFDKSRLIHYKRCVREIMAYAEAKQKGDLVAMKDFRESMLERHAGVLEQILIRGRGDSLSKPLQLALEKAPEIDQWLQVNLANAELPNHFYHRKPDSVVLTQGELCLDYGDGNRLYLCRFQRSMSMERMISILEDSVLNGFVIEGRRVTLLFDALQVELENTPDQRMYLTLNDRLSSVW